MSEVNKNIVQSFLQSKGLNNKAVAGIMGNIRQESNFDSNATNASSGAFGLFQWLGTRKNELINFAVSLGKSASDITTQLEFFWSELESSESKTMAVLTGSNFSTASEYAEAFEASYERSGGSALEKRKTYAEMYYSQMGSESGSTNTGVSGVKSGNAIGLEWWGDVVKVILIISLIGIGVVMGVLSVNSTVNEIV